MEKINLKLGDTFETKNPMALGFMINGVQFLHSKDNKADKSHSGIIINANGDTFEAGIKVPGKFFHVYGSRNIYKDLGPNASIKIWRYTGPCKMPMKEAIDFLRAKYEGRIYPYWRLPLFIIPWIPKFVHFTDKPVCSESKSMYYQLIGARDYTPWGVNPDTLDDEQREWRDYELVFEGKLSF
jgi:hypothetical protein